MAGNKAEHSQVRGLHRGWSAFRNFEVPMKQTRVRLITWQPAYCCKEKPAASL